MNWKCLITKFSCNYMDIIRLLFGACNDSISDPGVI